MALGTITVTNGRGVATSKIDVFTAPPPTPAMPADTNPLSPSASVQYGDGTTLFAAGNYFVRAAFQDGSKVGPLPVTVANDTDSPVTL